MKASQLRDLTRRYAGGGFARDEYIDQRTRLIDGIVAGEIAIEYRELEPSANSRNGASTRRGWVLGGMALLVGMLVVAILAYFLDTDHPPQAAAMPTVSKVQPDPGVDLLRDFARTGAWSNAELERLEADWQKLSAFQQERARRTPAYRQLKHETTQRIAEQEALLAAGEMEALLQAGRLREFASRLGFIME